MGLPPLHSIYRGDGMATLSILSAGYWLVHLAISIVSTISTLFIIHDISSTAHVLLTKLKENNDEMVISPLYLKGNGDGMAASPFNLKENRDGSATSPLYLQGRWDGHPFHSI